jgi:hypothetical protein
MSFSTEAVPRSNEPTWWECSEGHRWEAVYNAIYNGNGCPHCAGLVLKTERDYHALAQKRGFKWVGKTLPQHTKERTLWKCKRAHVWPAPFNWIHNGNGCLLCAGLASKSEKDYHALGKKRRFKWVGDLLPASGRIKTSWRCGRGHHWEAAYGKIRIGRGCPHCSGTVRKTEENFHALAKKRGFTWTAKGEVPTRHAKTRWRCGSGHTWSTSFGSILRGYGCPHCSGKARKTEADYHTLAKERGFEWLGKALPENNQAKSRWKCQRGHNWDACYGMIRKGTGCPFCSGCARKTEADYHSLAKRRGFRWIGEMLPESTNLESTQWQCHKGHTWKARYNSISKGTGCPHCWNERRSEAAVR